jgi:hypothetical protein
MELREFIKLANMFLGMGFTVTVVPHRTIDSEYSLFIYITDELYFSYDIKNCWLYLEDNEGVVFIKECDPREAIKIIQSFADSL